MSYVLDAGRFGHTLDALAPRYFNHAAVDYNDVIGSGKAKVTFDHVDVREGRALRRRGRRHCAAPRRACCARAWSPSMSPASTRRWSVRCCRCWRGWSGAASRSTGRCCRGSRASSRSAAPRWRPRCASSPAIRSSIPAARSSSATSCSARCSLPGGTKTKTGQWSTGARVLDELAEQGHRAAAEDSGMAAGHQAQVDLHRRAAGLHQPDDQARAHELRAGRDADRAPLVVRAEPAEHPDPHRGRPQDPPRLRGDAGQQAGLGRLFADRAAAARRDRRRAGAAAGVQGRARHPRA